MRRPLGCHRGVAVLTSLVGLCAALRTAPAARQPADALDPWSYHSEEARFPMVNYLELMEETCSHHYASEEWSGRIPEFMKWHFAPPQSSEWLDFDIPKFCRTLSEGAATKGRARMLFVGDSMSFRHWQSLVMRLDEAEVFDVRPQTTIRDSRVSEEDWAVTRMKNHVAKNGAALACNGSLWLQQEGTTNGIHDYSQEFVFADHADWLRTFDVVILMLPWTLDTRVMQALDFWTSALLPHQKLIVRTATIGHEHTGALYNHSWRDEDVDSALATREHRAPLRTPEELVQYFGNITGHKSWLNRRAKTERVLADLRQKHPGVIIMDVFYLTSMMWDRHRDPLHYCIPGPVDRWNDVLFNLLVRGHLRDYEEWERSFAKAVEDLHGLRNHVGEAF